MALLQTTHIVQCPISVILSIDFCAAAASDLRRCVVFADELGFMIAGVDRGQHWPTELNILNSKTKKDGRHYFYHAQNNHCFPMYVDDSTEYDSLCVYFLTFSYYMYIISPVPITAD